MIPITDQSGSRVRSLTTRVAAELSPASATIEPRQKQTVATSHFP